MRAALVFHRPGGEHRFELTGSAVTIGRGADCELQLADDRISTRHCRISAHGGDWMIEDLKSTNRTFVNGEPLGDLPRRLRHGDMVRLGARDTQLFEARFVIDERADDYRAGQWSQHDRINDTEDSRVGANSQGQSDHRNRGKAGILAQLA